MLRVEGIHTYYGLSHILFDVSLEVSQGEIVGHLGRNGAGKSTTMKSIGGWIPPKQGTITFKGQPIVDFVSEALCKSQVEKVFIVHHVSWKVFVAPLLRRASNAAAAVPYTRTLCAAEAQGLF